MRTRLPKGHLRKRGNVWWAQWKHRGVPYAVSLRTRDSQVAQRRFAEAMSLARASIVDGTFVEKYGRDGTPDIEDGDLLLTRAWRHYLSSVRRPDSSPQTLRQYEYQWGRFLRWVRSRHPDTRHVSKVTSAMAEEFAAHLAKEVSANTYNKYLQLLRLVFRIVGLDIGSRSNPWDGISKKKVNGNGNGKGRRPFTKEELRRVFVTLDSRTRGVQLVWDEDGVADRRVLPKRDRDLAGEMLTLCLLGFHTGLRLGDCCLLRWDDVDFDRMMISAVPMKTARTSGRRVNVSMHEELAARLVEIRPERAEGFVCPVKAGQYGRNRAEVDKRFTTLFRQCGIRTSVVRDGRRACEVGFHSFRHTWVTEAAHDGMDAATIREVVGWGSPAMQRIYTHLSPEHVAGQMAKRTGRAFPGRAAGKPRESDDIRKMSAEEIRTLVERAEKELTRRGEKC